MQFHSYPEPCLHAKEDLKIGKSNEGTNEQMICSGFWVEKGHVEP